MRERKKMLLEMYIGERERDQLGRHHGTQAENSIIKRSSGIERAERKVQKKECKTKTLYTSV
jgi:hypothetical protein